MCATSTISTATSIMLLEKQTYKQERVGDLESRVLEMLGMLRLLHSASSHSTQLAPQRE